ncbi:hypothetical protein ACOSP7_003961 [Xanthoceras sorbifolium]
MCQMIWQPYTSELLVSLPDVCVRDQHLWRTIAPLIFFDIVEWHRPDRVLRQFGLNQEIPVHCYTEVKLHAVDRRGRQHYNWKVIMNNISSYGRLVRKAILLLLSLSSTLESLVV